MLGIAAAIAVLGVLIIVHEFGHFIVAKRSGVGILKFSVGFGPKLFGRTVNGTEYALSAIPLGSSIHNIEIAPGRGGQIARSAGQQATLSNREAGYALVRLPSGEIRRIHDTCCATIGQVGNVDHMNVVSGKAGRTRWQGKRPHVRGMVMNPIDHPNGGGQGKSKGGGGRQHLTSPWGQLAKGFKTRSKHKSSDRFIMQDRRVSRKK